MKITVRQVATAIGTVLGLVAGVWAFDNKYMPREVHELWAANIQQQMLEMQHNSKTARAQQWQWFWQQKVEEYTRTTEKDPGNLVEQNKLQNAIYNRDKWKLKVENLMNQ